MALDEDGALRRVEAGGKEHSCERPGLGTQLLRVVRYGEGVQVDYAEEVLLLRLPIDPSLDRPQVVAQMDVARGLNAAEDALLGVRGLDRSSPRCLLRLHLWNSASGMPTKNPSAKGRVWFPWCHLGFTPSAHTAAAPLASRRSTYDLGYDNGASPSMPTPRVDRGLGWKLPGPFGLCAGAGSHLTRLSGPRWRPTTPVHSLSLIGFGPLY